MILVKMSHKEFEASLVYKVSSRTARTVTQRNPVLKKKAKRKESQKQTKSLESGKGTSMGWRGC